MKWLRRRPEPVEPVPAPPPKRGLDFPLVMLVHAHPKEALPPGPLEDEIVALDQDAVVLHAVAGVVQPDGTIRDLPEEKVEWAARLSYRHLKREGCLAEFGIPIIPAYEGDDLLGRGSGFQS